MSKDNGKQLYEAAETGTLGDLRVAFEACNYDEQKEYGYWALWRAADNPHSNALDMMKFLIERGVKPDSKVFWRAVLNQGSNACEMVKLLVKERVVPNSSVFAAGNKGPCASGIANLIMKFW